MDDHDEIAEAAEELTSAYRALESKLAELFGVSADVAVPNAPAGGNWRLAWKRDNTGWGLFIGVPGNYVPAANACLEARVLAVEAVESLVADLVDEQDEKVGKVRRAAEKVRHLTVTMCR